MLEGAFRRSYLHVISVVDPEARHAHKTVHQRQDGFKAHIAIEPDTSLITDCTLSRADPADAGHDSVIKAIPLRAAVPGGLTLDDFTVDHAAGTVTYLVANDARGRAGDGLIRLGCGGGAAVSAHRRMMAMRVVEDVMDDIPVVLLIPKTLSSDRGTCCG